MLTQTEPVTFEFQSQIDTRLGGTFYVFNGAHIRVTQRPDFLWAVTVEDQPTQYAITSEFLNQMAGTVLVQ